MATLGEQNTRLRAPEMRRMRQVIDNLLSTPLPAPQIMDLIKRSGGPQADSFERYAGWVLHDAGAEELAGLSPHHVVRLVPPTEGHLARLICSGKPNRYVDELLANVESALNRLIAIADAVEDSADLDLRNEQEHRISISIMGGGFLPNHASYRSALVKLPAIGRAESPDPAYFNEVDWRVLDHVAANGRAVFQRSLLPNMHQSFMGAHAPDGSDWDVRTRLAAILEGLELSLRFSYRFDCSIESGTVAVAFNVPPTSLFPQRLKDSLGRIVEAGKKLREAHMAYSLRLACLVAAACFGSGRRVERAIVEGYEENASENPAFSCTFNRKTFVHRTLCAIDSGALADPALRFNPALALEIAAPDEFQSSNEPLEGEAVSVASAEFTTGNRIAPHLDDRVLPQNMQRLFHAKRVCDIDTAHYHGEMGSAVHEALKDSRDSLVAAIAHLENVVETLEGNADAPDDDADARALFCANPLSRAVVSLLDDDLTIGSQAESYLLGENVDGNDIGALPRYFRAPSALYHAHVGLSDLYEQLGDFQGADAEADRCIALAPTTAGAYFRKADVLAQQGRFHEAANVITAGLHTAVDLSDCALLYYHLALILWNIDHKQEAAAIHVYAASLQGEYAEKAARVVEGLRKRKDKSVLVHASPLAAARELQRARIPLAPSDEAKTLVLQAAVGLSCANAPEAAAPYAIALSRYIRDDRILQVTARSLAEGLGK